ncbi:MAG: hypothetical protein WAV23_02515 [Minisyncoccia bacterium]
MNKIFNQVDDRGKLIISEFVKEEKLGVVIYFNPEGRIFLREHYKRIYDIWIEKENNFTALITGISKEGTLKVQMLKSDREVIEGSNDCLYKKFTPPLYPDGVTIEVPINLIKDLGIFNTKILSKM